MTKCKLNVNVNPDTWIHTLQTVRHLTLNMNLMIMMLWQRTQANYQISFHSFSIYPYSHTLTHLAPSMFLRVRLQTLWNIYCMAIHNLLLRMQNKSSSLQSVKLVCVGEREKQRKERCGVEAVSPIQKLQNSTLHTHNTHTHIGGFRIQCRMRDSARSRWARSRVRTCKKLCVCVCMSEHSNELHKETTTGLEGI